MSRGKEVVLTPFSITTVKYLRGLWVWLFIVVNTCKGCFPVDSFLFVSVGRCTVLSLVPVVLGGVGMLSSVGGMLLRFGGMFKSVRVIRVCLPSGRWLDGAFL